MSFPYPTDIKDFILDNLVDRRTTNSLKWDALQERFGNAHLLPLWVADSEFKTPQVVRDALQKQVQHGVFGYSITPPDYFDAFSFWQKSRHGITLKREWLRFDTGVVNSLYALINWLTKPDDNVLIMEPVYYPFINTINDNQRNLVSCNLTVSSTGWQIDFTKMEQILAEKDIKLFILCSPHNPVGRIWTREEITRILHLCSQYGVMVVADEIHQDFEIGKRKFFSVLNVADKHLLDKVIVVNSASKSFNLATLLNSHVIIPSESLRSEYDAFIKKIHQTEVSLLGQIAAKTAYENGGEWFDNLLKVIRFNYELLKKTLGETCPEVSVADLEGTYLSYINLAPIVDSNNIQDFVQNKCGLAVDLGSWFSKETPTYIRLNLATDPAIVEQAAKQLATQLALIKEKSRNKRGITK